MENVKLSAICDLKNGFAFKSKDYVEHSNTLSCRMSSIRVGGIFDLKHNPRYLPDNYSELYSNYLLKDGDLVIAMTDLAGDPKILGVPTIVKTNGYNLLQNQRVGQLVILDKKKVFTPYLQYALNRPENKIYYKKFAGGGLQINVGKKEILNNSIPLPSYNIQQKIAAILDEADKLRQLDKKLIKKYEDLSQSLFLEMFGDLVNNQKNWDIISFGKVFNSIRYGTGSPPIYQKEGIPFIRATNVKKGTVEIKGMTYISMEEAEKIKKCKLNEGDLIIVRSGANTGDCCRIPKEYQNSYGGFDLIVELEEPHSTFYNFLLNTIAGKTVLEPLTRRAGQPHLNSKQITELQLINPPITLQNQFADLVREIEKQKIQEQEALQKSEELFNSLLQKAFKGELV